MAAVSSSQVIENIHEQLICAVCLERFTDPKFLSCLHTFCCQCLHKITNQEPNDVITCPTCREETKIPNNGLEELRTNFFVNSMLDLVELKIEEIKKERKKGERCEQCQENDNATSRCIECDLVLCGGCIADHKRGRTTLDHRIVSMEEEYGEHPSLDKYTLTFCRYHTRNVIKYFCNTCDEAVCRVCTILEHREHQFVYPKEAMPQQKPIIEDLLIQTKTHLPVLKSTIKDIQNMQCTLKDCRGSIVNEITAKTQSRIDALMLAKENLIGELDRVYIAKQKTLSLQVDGVELELGKISGCCAFADNVLKFGNEVEILQIKSRLQELNKLSIKLDPEEDDSIQYVSESDSVQNMADSLGRILSSQTFASLSYAEGDGLETPRVGIETTVVVHAQNRHGKKSTGSDRVEATLVLPDETRKTLAAEDNGKPRSTVRRYQSFQLKLKPKPKPPRSSQPTRPSRSGHISQPSSRSSSLKPSKPTPKMKF